MKWINVVSLGVAIAAIVVSIIALIISGRQLQVQRTHNRLCVRPIVQFEKILSLDPTREFAGLYLRNDGAGIAILDLMDISFGGVVMHASTVETVSRVLENEGPFSAMAAVLRLQSPDFPSVFFRSSVASALRPGESVCLLGIRMEDWKDEYGDLMIDLFSQMPMSIHYRSLYEEEFTQPLGESRTDTENLRVVPISEDS